MDNSLITEKTFLGLLMNAEGEGFRSHYLAEGCQNLRRNALYTWMRQAIEQNKQHDIDFLEIMVSVVQQLSIDYPDLDIWPPHTE